jgi:hypothetical protein
VIFGVALALLTVVEVAKYVSNHLLHRQRHPANIMPLPKGQAD